MADQGDHEEKCNTEHTPICKGEQLSTKACTKTRRIASLIIHVERAIQRMKKFRLLQRVIPISIAAVANQAYLSVQLFVTC